MANSWGASGKATARVREWFLAGELVAGGPRSTILSSWQRSRSLGVSPDHCEPAYAPDFDLDTRFVRAAEPVLDWLESKIAGTRASVYLADDQGRKLLRRVGDASMISQLDASLDAPGFCFAEHLVGTNGIALALIERRRCRVLGHEHFAERYHPYVCVTVPVRDPLSGHVEGVLDFVGELIHANPAVDAMVCEAGCAIEQRMLEQAAERERALVRAYWQAERGARTLRSPEPLSGPGSSPGSAIGRDVRLILQEKAAELIASGHQTTVEIPLPHGHTAALLCKVVETHSEVPGLAVEVAFPSGPPSRIMTSTAAVSEHSDTAPAAEPRPPHAALSVPRSMPRPSAGISDSGDQVGGRRAADAWLLAVGEQGIGRLAVAARRRLRLLNEAGARIGTTLDVTRTAEELAEAVVPELADFATVDLREPVLHGHESAGPNAELHRVALRGIHEGFLLYPAGHPINFLPSTPQARCLASGQAVLEADLHTAVGWRAQDPERAEQLLAQGIHSLIAVPLCARDTTLGVVSLYRNQYPEPYEADDVDLAEELVTRAALCLDNARRYTREHTIALTLQRSLLPRSFPDQTAVEVAYRYLPAHADVGGVGGDWFDVIPLSGTRVALVVGDVVGHGLRAAVSMGRLRTAVHNFAALDLPPDELLSSLDDLVLSLDQNEATTPDDVEVIGATCLYAIYDPTSQSCTIARAGHPPPAVVHPDGTVYVPDLPAGPPLGLGGLPFEACELHLPEGSQLVLYSDGLIDGRNRDIDLSLDHLRQALARPDRPPEQACQAVLDALSTEHAGDDVTLLIARTRALDPAHIACWNMPADPAVVSGIRAAALRKLSQWGLDEAAFTTELILSELLSNAIRHASPPIHVRLLHDRTLICEVSDASSTSPHLRRAAVTDEGGRGLFLIAQLAARWGTRYTPRGKVIWAEQALG